MIGSARLETAIEALRTEVVADRERLSELSAQIARLIALTEERYIACTTEVTGLIGRVDRLEEEVLGRLDDFAASADRRTEAVGRLETASEEQTAAAAALLETVKAQAQSLEQVRADVARLDRQAASDLGEMRRTHAALAELVLARRPDSLEKVGD